MAILCRQYGLLFIQIGGTGSSSIGKLLREQYEGEQFPRETGVTKQGRVFNAKKHITLPEIVAQGHAEASELDQYLKVASVRNPFDFLVSAYSKDRLQKLHGVRDRKDLPEGRAVSGMKPDPREFERWLDNRIGFRRSIKNALHRALGRGRGGGGDYRGLAGIDRVIRFEHMVDDLNEVLAEVGAPPIDAVRNANAGFRSRDYTPYYSDRARRLAERVYGDVLDRFGYEF